MSCTISVLAFSWQPLKWRSGKALTHALIFFSKPPAQYWKPAYFFEDMQVKPENLLNPVSNNPKTDRINPVHERPHHALDEADIRTFCTGELFAHANEIRIIHAGEPYCLRITRSGKLILTK